MVIQALKTEYQMAIGQMFLTDINNTCPGLTMKDKSIITEEQV